MSASNLYPTAALRALDTAHYLHPFTDFGGLAREGSRIMVKGDGVWLTDSDGNRYLDGMAGLWCTNVGHGRREIAEAAHEQMLELAYYNSFFKTSNAPAIRLAEKLAEVAPAHMNRVFFCGSGSEANDTVFRMARHYWAIRGKPEKQRFIGRRNGYHGSTVAAASLGGMKPMHGQGGLLPGVSHIAQPYWFAEGGDRTPDEFGIWAARELEHEIERLGEDTVAAFIAEPIQGAGGVIIPPETYWPEIKRICAKYEILLVVDEVICGFGRTGSWFGSQTYDVEADLQPIAKGLTSGYLPMGGVMVSDEVARVLDTGGEFYHGYTYSGHPTCAAAALANLTIIEREGLVARVRDDIGPYLQSRWAKLGDHPLVGEARMKGLMGALELVPSKAARGMKFPDEGKVGTIARDISFGNGLIMRAVRDGLILSPPLTITHDEVDELVRLAEKTLDDTWLALKKEGLIA